MKKAVRISRYALVSGSCMVAHNVIMIAGDHFGLGLWASLATSFCLVVVLGYVLHSQLTFEVSGNGRSFVRYVVAMATNFPLTALLLWLLVGPAGLPMAAAAPLATIAMVVVNYFTSRWAIAPQGRDKVTV